MVLLVTCNVDGNFRQLSRHTKYTQLVTKIVHSIDSSWFTSWFTFWEDDIFTTYFLLEAQLLSNYVDATDSHRSAISAILFVDRFGRSSQFCHLEFDKEAICDGKRNENAKLLWSSSQYIYNSFIASFDLNHLSTSNSFPKEKLTFSISVSI